LCAALYYSLLEEEVEGIDSEKSSLMSQKNFEKRFGQSPVICFIYSFGK
jgi:hypothetical protein